MNDNDCSGGTRCNTALTPPHCYVLYCGRDDSPCSDPLQCGTGMTCLENHCQGPGTEGEDCSSDWACSTGFACVSQKCRARPAASGFTTAVTGTYLGRSLSPAYAWRMTSGSVSAIAIAITADFCSTPIGPGSMAISVAGGNSEVVGASTIASVVSLDAQCEGGSEYVDRGALITVWRDGDTRYGSFEVPLPNGESLQGTFKTRPETCSPPMENTCSER